MLKRKYKVTQTLNTPKVYRKWNEYSVGDIIVGTVVGVHHDNYEKDNLVIRIEDLFFKQDGAKFEGKNIVVNACGSLDAQVESVVGQGNIKDMIGKLVQVEYQGTNVMEKGKYKGKEAHSVSLSLLEVEGEETESVEDVEDCL